MRTKVAGGCEPLQVPPLERFEISGRWRNGGVIESDNLICGGHSEVLWALFCGDVPIKIMPIKIIVLAECRNPSIVG